MPRPLPLLLLLLMCCSSIFASTNTPLLPGKNISVLVNSKGKAIIGRDTLNMEELSKEIQERLWKSYLGTGKMYDEILLQYNTDTPAAAQTAAITAIKKGQEKALMEVCLQKYKNRFDNIGSKRQEKMKKLFPVLFQQEFHSSPS